MINKKEENDKYIDNDMETRLKLKKLEKIRKERRRISKENILKENKKIPLLRNNKINNITPILNS